MNEQLSYVIVTPYTIAKSRTGGVLSRLLQARSRICRGTDFLPLMKPSLKAIQIFFAPNRTLQIPELHSFLADYVEQNLSPSFGRRHRSLLLLFRGIDACKKLSDICGALYPENRSAESITGETIRDTYADLISDPSNPDKVTYFEPAILTPRSQDFADSHLQLLKDFISKENNIIQNVTYPKGTQIERTLVILKPDNWKVASSRPGAIIDMFSRTRLRVVGTKIHRFSVSQALEFMSGPRRSRLEIAPVFGDKAKEVLESTLKILP
jgi:nucleoside diphosphate kinase